MIAVPFGFGNRFVNKTPFFERTLKVLGIGSVNPIDDPTVVSRTQLQDYIDFYANRLWTHEWRRMLVEHEEELSEILYFQFPHFPVTKNPDYDAVQLLNAHGLFANDEGLMQFPPARSYSFIGSGAVLVGAEHPCYADVGFVDGLNCLLHRKHDIAAFREKVTYYLARPEVLAEIRQRGLDMVRTRYTHQQVAQDLYANLEQKWKCK